MQLPTFPTNLLTHKNVLLGVTGSISVYKSLELIRLLTKAGADVRVILTQGAQKFIQPLTFETLSGNPVLDESSENWHTDNNHIAIGKWADIFIIAPCTANTINKLANGIADNLLTQTALAYPNLKLIAPAANTNMINNPMTQASLARLQHGNFSIIGTQTKELACRTEGDGALAEPIELFYQCARALLSESFWEDRSVIVTGGGTMERIDDVRYISNFSSGKMASALAQALYLKGADVSFISSRFPTTLPSSVETHFVESNGAMKAALETSIDSTTTNKKTFLFMAAAAADYKPKQVQEGKLKKDALGKEWALQLTQNADILGSTDRSSIVTVGFKAEMNEVTAEAKARTMMETKDVEAVCLNILKAENNFGSDKNAVSFLTHSGNEELKLQDKLSLALQIAQKAEPLADNG